MNILTKSLLAFVMVVCLSAGSCTKKDQLGNGGVDDAPKIDPSLLVSCPALVVVDDSAPFSMGDLFEEYSNLQAEYISCAIKMDCLINATGEKSVACPPAKKE